MRSSFTSKGIHGLWPALPPFVLALVLLGFGHGLRALVLGATALVILVLLLAGADVVGWVRALVRAISAVVWSAVFMVTVVPAWAVSELRRHDPLDRREPPRWLPAAPIDVPSSLGSAAPSVARRRLAGRLAWAIGCVVLLLSVNYGLGLAWDTARGNDTPATVTVGRPASNASASGPINEADLTRDPRNDSPAMADDPWRTVYFTELQETPGTYWPFTENRPLSFRSDYVNIDDWARVSYEPPHVSATTMPTVWMFGGSATFGEGQRDGYTIASDVARLAQSAGTPLDITNYGQRGWTHFQEMLLYEQQLANNKPPVFSLFYDGANELTTQSLMTEAVPTQVGALAYAEKLSGLHVATQIPTVAQPDVLGDLWRAYEKHSAVNKVVSRLGFGSGAAGADPADRPTSPENPNRGYNTKQPRSSGGIATNYDVTVHDAKNAMKVYDDGRRLTLDLSRAYGVKSLLLWQPVATEGAPQRWAIDHLTAPTIDITHAMDGHHQDYIDGAHTNEDGAMLVAKAIWAHLQPEIQQWYHRHR